METKTVKYVVHSHEVAEHRIKMIARRKVSAALREGVMKRPDCCEICDRRAMVEGHHVDYGRPLEVRWLCDPCHRRAHHPDHPLNPINNEQTPVEFTEELKNNYVSINLTIPLENYVVLRDSCRRKNDKINAAARSAVIQKYPATDKPIEIQDLEEVHYDDARTKYFARVSSLVANDTKLQKPELSRVQEQRGQGDTSKSGMERFYSFSTRHGSDARGLQCANSN